MPALAALAAVTLDCPDPKELAEFYRQVLDWKIIYSDDNAAYLAGDGAVRLGLQRVEGYVAPRWPEQTTPQQSHLDLSVADLDTTEAELVKLGATKAEHQPGGDRWRVLLDPVGHPFCITTVV
jgi:predicted enzyme related to lactoylglutathione lyase